MYLCNVVHSPVAVPSLLNTCTVTSIAGELLNSNNIVTLLTSSLTLYVDWLNLTDITAKMKINCM